MNDDDLSNLRPTSATLDREWPAAERAELLREVLADEPRVRFMARSRPLRRVAVPVAAAAVAALVAGVLIAVMPGDHDDGSALQPLGEPFSASSPVPTPTVGPTQYAYRVSTYYETVKGRLTVAQRYEDWTDLNGNIWSLRTGGHGLARANGCFRFRFQGRAEVGKPTKRFLDRLPTDPDQLQAYLRKNVQGSTSRDEAVFVAVGDMLRVADLLATSTLRAAFVEVLSETGGVNVDPVDIDSRGRSTVRADFVDPDNRPGEISSLYFDPHTYQLLDETSRVDKAARAAYASQSYEQAPSATTVPDNLPAPTSMTTVDEETVVDALPARVAHCKQG